MTLLELSEILAPSPRLTLADEVVVKLRGAILNGVLPPEEPLREAALALTFGVSRGPIREAISRLAREGLVIERPNRSALVARLSREDLEEVYSLRAVLEPLAARRVCQSADPSHIAQLQEVVDAMNSMPGSIITAPEAASLDLRFHDVLFQASGHRRLIKSWDELRPQIHVFLLHRNTANPDFGKLLAHGHQEIVDALASSAGCDFVGVVTRHLEAGYQRVLTAYEQADASHSARSATLSSP